MTVVDAQGLSKNSGSLSLLMTERGTIKDDCIITKLADDDFFVVLNAGCKETDLSHLADYQKDSYANKDVSIEYSEANSLVAV